MTYMLLKIFVEDETLRDKYVESIDKHNKKMNEYYTDAGFDLFCPDNVDIINNFHKIDLKVKCAAFNSETGQPMSYYMYPRSSISKTPLRLANSVGIIDSGYRGNLMCAVDVHKNFTIEKHARYFQICSPTLSPIRGVMVNTLEDLGVTERGEGGFGSTGK